MFVVDGIHQKEALSVLYGMSSHRWKLVTPLREGNLDKINLKNIPNNIFPKLLTVKVKKNYQFLLIPWKEFLIAVFDSVLTVPFSFEHLNSKFWILNICNLKFRVLNVWYNFKYLRKWSMEFSWSRNRKITNYKATYSSVQDCDINNMIIVSDNLTIIIFDGCSVSAVELSEEKSMNERSFANSSQTKHNDAHRLDRCLNKEKLSVQFT